MASLKNKTFIIIILALFSLKGACQFIIVQPDSSGYIKGDEDYNLLIAAEKGVLKDVEKYVKEGADVNTKTFEGVTPLMYASQKGHLEVAEFLLEKGADTDLQPDDGISSLHGAVMFNNLDVAELLIQKKADINIQDKKGATPLMYAIAYGYFVMADMLIYYEASLDIADKQGNSPLSVAVYSGSYELTQLLLQNGANVNHQDDKGNTPLILASQFGYNDLADLLILYSADVNIQNNSNLTALSYAVEANNVELTELLIRKDANVNQEVNYAENMITIASRNKNDSIKKILLKEGAKRNYYPSISAISMGINGTFNGDDFISGLQFMLDEQKYKFSLNAGIEYRPKRIRVIENQGDRLYYQFWERRSVVYTGVSKAFKISQPSYDKTINAVLTTNLGYTWGNYRGYIQGPESKFMFLPEAGLMIKKPGSKVMFTYQYKDFKLDKVSPHRFNISLMFTINVVNSKFKQHYINWLE